MTGLMNRYQRGRALLAETGETTEHNTGAALLVQLSAGVVVSQALDVHMLSLGWTYDPFYHGYLYPLPTEGTFSE